MLDTETLPNEVPAYPTAKTSQPARIFTAGDYGEKGNWPVERLQQIVDSWHANQSPNNLNPDWAETPAVYVSLDAYSGLEQANNAVGIGHEDDQAYLKSLLERTDLPSAGWLTNLYLEGDALYAELDGVPYKVAALINGGQLPYCSAEFHHDYTDRNGASHGPALRRISLIGSEPPGNKGNGRLPPMVFKKPAPAGSASIPFFSAFSEGNPNMDPTTETPVAPAGPDRATIISQLADFGMDVSKIDDSVSDAALAEILRAFTTMKATATPADPAAFTEPEDPTKPKPAMFSERRVRAMVAEAIQAAMPELQTVKAQLGGVQRQLAATNQVQAQKAKAAERAEIATFCERLVRERKLPPAEMDGRLGPTMVDKLLALDDGAVATFGEKRTTARKAEMARLESRPVSSFGERMQDGDAAGSGMSPERRKQLLGHTHLGRQVLASKN